MMINDMVIYDMMIGMMLCACSTAVKDFKNIVSTVGGIGEQQRSK